LPGLDISEHELSLADVSSDDCDSDGVAFLSSADPKGFSSGTVPDVKFIAAAKEEGVSAGARGSSWANEWLVDPDSALEVLTLFLGDLERSLRFANEMMDLSANFLFPFGFDLNSLHDDRTTLAVEETDKEVEEADETEATGCWSSCQAKTLKSLYDSTNFSCGDEGRMSGDVGLLARRTEVVVGAWCKKMLCALARRKAVMWRAVVG
jgi:hypothetical protein